MSGRIRSSDVLSRHAVIFQRHQSSIVCRADDAPLRRRPRALRRKRAAVVVGRHHGSVRAGVAGSRPGRRLRAAAARRSRPKTSLLSQIGPTISYRSSAPARRRDRRRCGGRRRRAPAASARSCPRRAPRTAPPAFRGLRSTTRATSAPEGPTMRAAGLEDDRQPVRAQLRQQRGRVSCGRRHRATVVRDAEAAAEIDVLEREAVVAELGAELRRPRSAARAAARAS